MINRVIKENSEFLTNQIITYLGNKRALLNFIGEAILVVLEEQNKSKVDCVDLFSGSGIVARYLKQYSNKLITNDLENLSANQHIIDQTARNILVSNFNKKKNNVLFNRSPDRPYCFYNT